MEIISQVPCELTSGGIVEHVQVQVNELLLQWQSRVAEDPSSFGQIELEALAFGRHLAGLMTAAVLQAAEVREAVEAHAATIVKETAGRLRQGYKAERRVKWLCGLILVVSCLYCAPRQSKRGRQLAGGERGGTGAEGGLYPELAVLGIREGVSPQLQSEVGRLAGLLPSFEAAQEELAHRGAALDLKTVRRVGEELGLQALSHRRQELERWRRGEVAVGLELAGKRVGVAIDGGRARTRKNNKGRKSRKGRPRYATPWREPKLVIIYGLDEEGQIDRSYPPWVDGTLQGPDHLMEIVAYPLHRLGAAQAVEVLFVADGAVWIWDRIPTVVARVGLLEGQWFQRVDVYHVVEHLAEALQAAHRGSASQRRQVLKALKKQLLQGKIPEVIAALQGLLSGRGAKRIRQAIRYLEKRRPLMHYDVMKQHHLPVGSGAIESAIRRVINLRLKGPGIFWDEENLEAVMYLRAQALTGRWEELMANVYHYTRRTRKLDWKWKSTPMSIKKQKKLQPVGKQKTHGLAA